MRQCTKCRELKEASSFYSWMTQTGLIKYQSWCKECMKLHQATSRTTSLGGRKNKSKYAQDVEKVTVATQTLVGYKVPNKFKPFTTDSAEHCLFPNCVEPFVP